MKKKLKGDFVTETDLSVVFVQLMHYWVGVTESVKNWIRACSVCQSRLLPPNHEAPVQFCLVYGCNNSSYANPELSFYR